MSAETELAEAIGRATARLLFEGRQGHGGGRVVYRQLDRGDIGLLVTLSVEAGRLVDGKGGRDAEATAEIAAKTIAKIFKRTR